MKAIIIGPILMALFLFFANQHNFEIILGAIVVAVVLFIFGRRETYKMEGV